jgi:hypothetical protein
VIGPERTPEEMVALIRGLKLGTHTAIVKGMKKAAAKRAGEAILEATPGHSEFDPMIFPTKVVEAGRVGAAYSGAPYSVKMDVIHLRDTIYSDIEDKGDLIMGIVGATSDHALWVHEGTSKMEARPFIYNPLFQNQADTAEILMDALQEALQGVQY